MLLYCFVSSSPKVYHSMYTNNTKNVILDHYYGCSGPELQALLELLYGGVAVLSGNGCDRDCGTCHEVFFIRISNKVRKIHHMINLIFCPDFYIS